MPGKPHLFNCLSKSSNLTAFDTFADRWLSGKAKGKVLPWPSSLQPYTATVVFPYRWAIPVLCLLVYRSMYHPLFELFDTAAWSFLVQSQCGIRKHCQDLISLPMSLDGDFSCGVNLTELEIRLTMTWINLSLSPMNSGNVSSICFSNSNDFWSNKELVGYGSLITSDRETFSSFPIHFCWLLS